MQRKRQEPKIPNRSGCLDRAWWTLALGKAELKLSLCRHTAPIYGIEAILKRIVADCVASCIIVALLEAVFKIFLTQVCIPRAAVQVPLEEIFADIDALLDRLVSRLQGRRQGEDQKACEENTDAASFHR